MKAVRYYLIIFSVDGEVGQSKGRGKFTAYFGIRV
jgi:hypothetical protein